MTAVGKGPGKKTHDLKKNKKAATLFNSEWVFSGAGGKGALGSINNDRTPKTAGDKTYASFLAKEPYQFLFPGLPCICRPYIHHNKLISVGKRVGSLISYVF